ncbi:hypothetical protein CVIRNUC_011004 [Coccomyxa viridis]|uniref:Transmembrane protein n=1 Tax=Coccomyxa viridis TaxID=1274662 RepID=A0AAV1INF8_9CHLO|nr:hypothetical protein CVIRNUC_011004 [Coccomyxa viridis]
MSCRQLSHLDTTSSPRCNASALQHPHVSHCAGHGSLQGLRAGLMHVRRPVVLPAAFQQGRLSSCQGLRSRQTAVRAAGNDNNSGQKNGATPFGYTRKDVILLGVGILGFGYALYYGLQAAGYDALVAGNSVQIFVFLGIGVGYISTYIFRVANKEMTYVKQLEDYEEAVMQKRLDEMPQAERERILGEIEQQKQGNGQQGGK